MRKNSIPCVSTSVAVTLASCVNISGLMTNCVRCQDVGAGIYLFRLIVAIIRGTVMTYSAIIGILIGIVQLVYDGTHDTIYGRWVIVGEPKMPCWGELIPFDIKFS